MPPTSFCFTCIWLFPLGWRTYLILTSEQKDQAWPLDFESQWPLCSGFLGLKVTHQWLAITGTRSFWPGVRLPCSSICYLFMLMNPEHRAMLCILRKTFTSSWILNGLLHRIIAKSEQFNTVYWKAITFLLLAPNNAAMTASHFKRFFTLWNILYTGLLLSLSVTAVLIFMALALQ